MPTPAEIIAARLNHSEDVEQEPEPVFGQEPKSRSTTPSISDESAFPALGSKASSNVQQSGASSWGPKMKAPPTKTATSASGFPKTAKSGNGFAVKPKTSTIQEAFSLDVEDQLNVARAEFIKILTYVMQETKTSVECTTSQHTKKRTFLISGKPDDVKIAKRLVVKKLTKPVQIKFNVPAKLRSRIIGQGGKTLKPIIQANEVKIEIGDKEESHDSSDAGQEEDDDLFATTVVITIDGDVEGAKAAKNEILTIVKEETKNLTVKVPLDEKVKPFAETELQKVVDQYDALDFSIPTFKSASNNIVIHGERELVLEARSDVRAALEKLSQKIVTEEVPIPKTKYQFLPIDEVLSKCNVLIQLPKEGETNVKFAGEKKNIKLAQEEARKVTSQYKVEVLDMSKAHKGNLRHVSAVAAYLNKIGAFKTIADANDVVINTPSIKELNNESSTSIPIQIVSKGGDEHIKAAKKSIVSQVNKITPDQTKVIDDIESFLLNKVDGTIRDIAKKENVEYIILHNTITLFKSEDQQEEAEDFDDFGTSGGDSFDKVNSTLDTLRELAANLSSATLEVASKDQDDVVSGPKGVTLKSILSSIETDSVSVKLHSNGSSPSENEIYIHGIKSSVAAVKKEIESVLADAKEYPNGFIGEVRVPSQTVSRLVGKNGTFLNSLRDEFGVKIDVQEQDAKKDESDKSDVTIKGVKKNVEAAKAKISALAKKWADETLVRVRIENQYHRRMIGAQGVFINRLQDKYNVKIRFPAADTTSPSPFADAPKSKDEVTIKGPSKGVAKAEEELQELYQFEKENGFKKQLQIPSKAVARVIGKSGETINDIADGTGVEYTFKRDNEESSGIVELELTGSKSALKEASTKVQEIVDEVENFVVRTIKVDPKYHRDLVGPSGSVMKQIISTAGGDDLPRSKYHRLLAIPNEGSGSDEVVSQGDKAIVDKIISAIEAIVKEKEASVVEEIDLPKDKHRLIIGPSGSIRHSLQSEFGVTIEIPRPNNESTIVKVSGLPEKVAAAKEKIEALTKDDWKVSIDILGKYHPLVSEHGAVFKKLKSDYKVEVSHGNFTRQASKLSSSSIPVPPESAYPDNDEDFKFTTEKFAADSGDDVVIPWRLKGEEKNVEKAAEFINKKLELAESADSQGWLYASKPAVFSKIIGPQGSKINQLRAKTNTFITIPKASDKFSKFVYLVGAEDNLNKAYEEIKKLV
ncbi:SCP160 [Candida margitis]|uniref:SCP160 n=1 Tax=Candida margitis TaxID=1775924 RepID=UPI0022262F72|nr:SCP160 [Candida margitis]KAI5968327.1 SCP160 [Candida margitis]